METSMLTQSEKAASTARGPAREKRKTIRFVVSVAGARFDYVAGEVKDVDPNFAAKMIAAGYAVPV